ncbi:MAG: hypothetical protein EOO17_06210 [Chloroflexi bacterium]|nr:MAG: hypothetical protein EOO17_06210 [Chloroflexota bacterium]
MKKDKLSNMKFRRKLAITAMIAPGTLLVIALAMLTIVNLIFNPTFWMKADSEPVQPTPFVISAFNIFFILTGAAGFICILPGAVIGAILLIRLKKVKSDRN